MNENKPEIPDDAELEGSWPVQAFSSPVVPPSATDARSRLGRPPRVVPEQSPAPKAVDGSAPTGPVPDSDPIGP